MILGDIFRIAFSNRIQGHFEFDTEFCLPVLFQAYWGKTIRQKVACFGSSQNSSFELEVGNTELTKGNRSTLNCLKLNSNCWI